MPRFLHAPCGPELTLRAGEGVLPQGGSEGEDGEGKGGGGVAGGEPLPDAPEIVAACKAIKALKRKADTSPFSSFKARSMVSDEVEEEIGRDTTLGERMMRLVSSRFG